MRGGLGAHLGRSLKPGARRRLATAVGLLFAALPATALAITDGDIQYTYTWTQGPGQHQSTLVITNTGSTVISDVTIAIKAPGRVITGATSKTTDGYSDNCTVQGNSKNQIYCPAPLNPGQKETVIITTDQALATDSGGTATFHDSSEVSQPTQALSGPSSSGTPCPLNPKVNLPCADVAVNSVSLGTWFSCISEGIPGWAHGNGSGFHPRNGPFLEGDEWAAGVEVTNNGPSSASVRVHLRTQRAQVTYGGVERFGGPRGSFCKGQVHLDKRSVIPLAPHASETVVFFVQMGGGGTDTFTGTAQNVSPPDPIPGNNSSSTTYHVGPRDGFDKVKLEQKGGHWQLAGGVSSPAGSLRDHASVASGPPIEIALVRADGSKCAWLTGHPGRFGPSSSRVCPDPVWLTATGVNPWTYGLAQRPPHGTYYLLARVGAGEQYFSQALHNQFKLQI